MFSLLLKWFAANCWNNWYRNNSPTVKGRGRWISVKGELHNIEKEYPNIYISCNLRWNCYKVWHKQVLFSRFMWILVFKSRPGFQRFILLLHAKRGQLVQSSSQFEHPRYLDGRVLLSAVGFNRRVKFSTTFILSCKKETKVLIGKLECVILMWRSHINMCVIENVTF